MYGDRLIIIRTEKGLSQSEFAKMFETSQRNISRYEREQLDLSTDFIVRVCKTFDISADYLLGLKDY